MKGLALMTSGNPAAKDDVRGPAAFDLLMTVEQEAAQIFLNQPSFLPGLLQVPGYAAEMIGRIAGLAPGDPQLTQRVNVRMQRAEAFAKRQQGGAPPQLWAVIDEAVLRRLVGGPAVMREQLEHLVAVSELDSVHLGIIPFSHGAHPGLDGPFEAHEMSGGHTWVYFEGQPADQILGSDQALARRCREVVQTTVDSAVSGPEARRLLAAIIQSL